MFVAMFVTFESGRVSVACDQPQCPQECLLACFGVVRIVVTDRNQFNRTTRSNAMRFKPNETRLSGYTKRMRPMIVLFYVTVWFVREYKGSMIAL